VKLLQVEDLQSGVTFSVFEKDFKENIDQQFMVEIGSLRVLNQRETTISNVTRRIISGSEILQEDSWPGSYIPIIPVWGEEIFIKGKRQFRSLIRDVKDSQRMFNYWRSASTELVALAPKAPFIVAKNSIAPEDREKWATANNRSYSMLEYLADRGPMPQRQQFASVPSGAFQEALSAADDMKAITGIYDAALGARSNETSGRAILARQREADNSNFHFLDNLSRAIEWEGKLLVEIIPSVYGARQAVKILGEDQASKVVALTQGAPKGKLYNISTGVYDVEVKTGPSYTTKREETREFLIEIMRSVPNSAPLLGDVLMEHLDFIGNDRLAKRLKSLLPPEIKQAEEQEALESAEIPPEVQASLQYSQKQIQEQQQILQNMQAQLQQAMQEKEQLEKRIVSESDQKEINKAMSDLKSYQERLRTEEQGILSAKKELMLQEDIVKKSIQAEMLKYERDMASLKTEEEKQNNAQILATLNEVLMSVQRMTTQNKISDNLIAIEN
jgi:cob(I)alamin adenosyltransferase